MKVLTRVEVIGGKIRDVDPETAQWAVEQGLAKIVEKQVFDLSNVEGNLADALAEANAA